MRPYGESIADSKATCWSLIVRAGDLDKAGRTIALGELLDTYLPVLRAFAMGSLRLRAEQADDLVQGFVADKMLERNIVGEADRSKGRFRSFLIRSFRNYFISEIRRQRAAVRGVAPELRVNVDDAQELIGEEPRFEKELTIEWARQVLDQAVTRMRAECQARARDDIWAVFEGRILRPILEDAAPLSYDELVGARGIQSPAQASNILITGKRMFQRMIEDVVRETVDGESDVGAEIADLIRALSSGQAARL